MKSRNLIIPGNLVLTDSEFAQRIEFAKSVGNSVHIDVIDPSFVNGESLTISEWPKFEIEYAEAHLMVDNPIAYLAELKAKGITRAIIHVESTFDLHELQSTARELDILLGFAVNPDTDLTKVLPYLTVSNYVQVMGIYPGKTGQPYLPQTPLAVQYLQTRQPRLIISVDGGVSTENIRGLKKSGCDYFVASSAIYNLGDWSENYLRLLETAQA